MPETDFSTMSFAVEQGELVVRAVARRSGAAYRHACDLASFEQVARTIDGAAPAGLTREEIQAATGLPWTRIQVALLFLNERSCVNRAGRRGARYEPASAAIYEDAMTEYHALAQQGPA